MDTHRHRTPRTITIIGTCLLAGFALAACSGDEQPAAPAKPAQSAQAAKPESAPVPKPAPAPEPAAATPADLAARGRTVYMANCIACHSQDPTMDGALGPAIAGSPRELIEARVMRAEYPPGYKPKRDSRVMIALPHLGGELDALAAYLQAAAG